MEQTAPIEPACKRPWSSLALAAAFVVAAAMVWTAFRFGTDGGKPDAAAAGAQMFLLSLGPIWAGAGARRCRCPLFSRKAKPSPEADQRPWHER